MPRRLVGAALTILVGVVAAAALAAPSVVGRLTQLSGSAGCVSATGSKGACIRAAGLVEPVAVAVSPAGRNVYVAGGSAIGVFARGQGTGALRPLAKATGASYFVTVAPDGKNVYAISTDGTVVVYARDAGTGALTRLDGRAGCVSEDGSGGRCADGRGLIGAAWLGISPDGRHVYVAAHQSDSIAVFARDPKSGGLAQLEGPAGCLGDRSAGCARARGLNGAVALVVSRDGKHVYLAAGEGERAPTFDLATFRRNATTGALTQFDGLRGQAPEAPSSITASADGRSVYVGSVQGISVYARKPATGVLARLPGNKGCLIDPVNWDIDGCSHVRALGRGPWVTVSGDSKSVYAASADGVAVFARDPRTGALLQLSRQDGCLATSVRGCGRMKTLASPASVAVSADGRNVYVIGGPAALAVFRRESR